jgi:hypothetical protein
MAPFPASTVSEPFAAIERSAPYAIERSEAKSQGADMAFRFEGLEIFHVAVEFSVSVYELVKKFPAEERFDLTSQARRAANSIVLNIAEGSGRGNKERFLSLSRYRYRVNL